MSTFSYDSVLWSCAALRHHVTHTHKHTLSFLHAASSASNPMRMSTMRICSAYRHLFFHTASACRSHSLAPPLRTVWQDASIHVNLADVYQLKEIQTSKALLMKNMPTQKM